MHNLNQKKGLTRENPSQIKPEFMIAGNHFKVKDLPAQVIVDHLETQLAKRDELAQKSLPKDRLSLLIKQ